MTLRGRAHLLGRVLKLTAPHQIRPLITSVAPVDIFRLVAAMVGSRDRIVRVKSLGGQPIKLRGGTSDGQVLVEVFRDGFHMPTLDDPGLIWDLGANIGLTTAHYAYMFPSAQVRGIELDPGNAALARENTATYGERVDILSGAVWTHDGEITYGIEPGMEYSASVANAGKLRARAYSLNSLITEPVDFMKVDIEGAERELLKRNTEWSARVKSMYVECHGYPVEECLADLRSLGFRAHTSDRHWSAVIATRSK